MLYSPAEQQRLSLEQALKDAPGHVHPGISISGGTLGAGSGSSSSGSGSGSGSGGGGGGCGGGGGGSSVGSEPPQCLHPLLPKTVQSLLRHLADVLRALHAHLGENCFTGKVRQDARLL